VLVLAEPVALRVAVEEERDVHAEDHDDEEVRKPEVELAAEAASAVETKVVGLLRGWWCSF
jgi:hypothetical protein